MTESAKYINQTLAKSKHLVESTRDKVDYLWRRFHSQIEWRDVLKTKIIEISKKDSGLPVRIFVSVNSLNGVLVTFYESVSGIASRQLVEDFFNQNREEESKLRAESMKNFAERMSSELQEGGEFFDQNCTTGDLADVMELPIIALKTCDIYGHDVAGYLKKFAQKMNSIGSEKVLIKRENGTWTGEIFIAVPSKITPEFVIAVASESPDECDIDCIGGSSFIRIWRDIWRKG